MNVLLVKMEINSNTISNSLNDSKIEKLHLYSEKILEEQIFKITNYEKNGEEKEERRKFLRIKIKSDETRFFYFQISLGGGKKTKKEETADLVHIRELRFQGNIAEGDVISR